MWRAVSILCFAFAIFACTAKQKSLKTNYAKEGYVKAVVKKYEVENCGFLIELTDAERTRLAPDKLSDEFKKDQLKVWVKYTVAKKQMPGTCMAGKQSEIVDIQKR